jgi:hypothetical protein
MQPSRATVIRTSAYLAAALVLAQIVMFFATGVGQDPLQFQHSPSEYMELLLHNPSALRAVLALDNTFAITFSVLFVALARVSDTSSAPTWLIRAAHGLLLLLGLLDLGENMHFMSMLQAAEQGIAPTSTEISIQVWESLFKFHVGYLGVLLLSFALPMHTAGERALAFAMRWVNVPVGVLIYCVPQPWSKMLLFGRFGFFLYSLIAVGWLFGRVVSGSSDATSATSQPAQVLRRDSQVRSQVPSTHP